MVVVVVLFSALAPHSLLGVFSFRWDSSQADKLIHNPLSVSGRIRIIMILGPQSDGQIEDVGENWGSDWRTSQFSLIFDVLLFSVDAPHGSAG